MRRFNAFWHAVHSDTGSKDGLLHDGLYESEMGEEFERARLKDTSEHRVPGCMPRSAP